MQRLGSVAIPAPRRRRSAPLSLGISTAYLSVIVLIPLAALTLRSLEGGLGAFWDAVTDPQAVAALKLTFAVSLVVVLINAVAGTVIAWVLVRDSFRGKGLVNTLIDLPFALPTIVAGLTLLALYGPKSPIGVNVAYTTAAIVLALLFVTLPFVVRTVQPVLLELDRDMEEAAQSLGATSLQTFRRVIFPNLFPAILSGTALGFARALGYLAALLVVPVGLVVYRAFEDGVAAFVESITTPEALHALWLTVVITLIAVPLNTVFGVMCALAIVRRRFRGHGLVNSVVDLPLALSPVVVGLALVLVYGRNGWWGGWLIDNGFQVIYALPGMVLATVFVSLPFVVREVVPVLREIGDEQEQAASTLGASPWQTFWKITLPAIRWGIAYGVVLTTARALGEFGAVSVVSGRIAGRTETMTLHVEERFQAFEVQDAYAASVVLALLAVCTLLAMTALRKDDA